MRQPCPTRRHFQIHLGITALSACLISTAVLGRAQNASPETAELPSAPLPETAANLTALPIRPKYYFSQDGIGVRVTDVTPDSNEHQDAPIVTMLPHPEDAIYWISGQANIIFQGRPAFHSLYQGSNSFRNSAEYKTSMVGTLYLAARRSRSIRYNTDFIYDEESAGGRGLSEALGLAGFTNLDVVRNPNLGSVPYSARYEIHQVIGLSRETSNQDAGPFALATSVPLRRLEFRVGKNDIARFLRHQLSRLGQPSPVYELDH